MSKCKTCTKSVYPMDPQINLDGSLFHKPCAKCADCSCQITISNFTKTEIEGKTVLLCKTHYFKRFKEGGAYVGGEKYSKVSTRDANANSRRSSVTSADGQAAVTTASTNAPAQGDNNETVAAGSVRERIASLRVTEKTKTPSNPPSRRGSLSNEGSKSQSFDTQQQAASPAIALETSLSTASPPITPNRPIVPEETTAAPEEVVPPQPPLEESTIDAPVEDVPVPVEETGVSAPAAFGSSNVEEIVDAREEESVDAPADTNDAAAEQ